MLIPKSLITRLVVHNHFAKLHTNLKEELKGLEDYYFDLSKGITKKKIVLNLREKCLHCHRSPKLIRRKLNETIVSRIPREVLHSDFYI